MRMRSQDVQCSCSEHSLIIMSWRAFAGRNISRVWVFADPTAVSPGQASHGVTKWYNKAFGALKELNPTMPLCIRGVKGTPAVINVHYGASLQASGIRCTPMKRCRLSARLQVRQSSRTSTWKGRL